MTFDLDSCIQSCMNGGVMTPYTSSCFGTCYSSAGWQSPPSSGTAAWCSVVGVLSVLLSTLVACIMASTLGLDSSTLQAALMSSEPELRKKAKKVEGLRNQSNLLLCSLLVFSTILHVMATAVFIQVMGYIAGSIVAALLLLLFTEMLPPGICNNRSLSVAANTAWVSWACIMILFPLAWPLSGLLAYLVSDSKHSGSLWSCCGYDNQPKFHPNIIMGAGEPEAFELSRQSNHLLHSPSHQPGML